MSDFSDRPFVAGSLVGLRAFDVDALGRLAGPSFGGIFQPGENVATCGGGRPELAALARAQRDLARSMARWEITYGSAGSLTKSAVETKKAPHVTAGKGCSCGFYAYFDGRNDYAKASRVAAVIEGYGVCTVGERGFRSEKARLLAIVDPSALRWWQTWKLSAIIATFCAVALVTNLLDRDWLWVGVEAFLVAINVASSIWSYRVQRKTSSRLALVRRNYPDVPRFRTEKAALKAHPLTPPEPVTPQTTDDFWTRSAS